MQLTISNQIIDTDKLTSEEREQLRQALEVKASGRFVPEETDKYSYIDNNGRIMSSYWDNLDYEQFQLLIGNVFRTKAEAEAHLAYLKAVATIKADAEYWQPDWSNNDEAKYFGYYYKPKHTLDYTYYIVCRVRDIFFQSKEKIQQSQKDHEAEWLIYLGVK